MNKIILASKSKARQQILENAGIDCDIYPPNIDENIIKQKIINSDFKNKAVKIAAELAMQKALYISNQNKDSIVIAGDQTLSLNGVLYSKPKNKQGVINHLTDFSGKVHLLHSGIAIAKNNEIIFSGVYNANMSVKKLSKDYIDWYADLCGDIVCSSVGAYNYEGLGIQLFDKVEGDYFTILGLPMIPIVSFLQDQGILKC